MKIIAVGMNYAQHNKELGHTQVDNKQRSIFDADDPLVAQRRQHTTQRER